MSRHEGVDESGNGFWKSALLGGGLALLIAIGAAVGYFYFRDTLTVRQSAKASRVVIVAASPAADGSTVANLIVTVANGRGVDVSPDTSVTIPGTSFGRLGDAYSFGGAASVAGAIPTTATGGSVGWIDLPASAWQTLLDRSGGVTVTVPSSVRVFDGNRLTSFSAGAQKLSGADVATLLMGSAGLPEAAKAGVRVDIERGLLSALAAESSPETLIQTNLSADDLKGWLRRLSQAPIEPPGTVVP